ncbi:MAG: choice-of-anchor U domain-containing protein [bacterium]
MAFLSRSISYPSSVIRLFLCLLGTFLLIYISVPPVFAGPFEYGNEYEYEKYDRVHMTDSNLIGWATGFENYEKGTYLDPAFETPEKALGEASGNVFDIVSLGRGGAVTLLFEHPIRNGAGWDFAVFENSYDDRFLELAYVEVSSDGEHFVRFNSCSLTASPVSAFGNIDFTNITGLAGKYRKGYGTPFDLSDLARSPEVISGIISLNRISHVRIVDIVGDGTYYDTRSDAIKTRYGENAAIYDPYPTLRSAGFDLEAVGVRYHNTDPDRSNRPPLPPFLRFPECHDTNVAIHPTLVTEPFSDPDQDIHIATRWQISKDETFSGSSLILDLTSSLSLTSLTLQGPLLDYGQTYYWRVKFYDDSHEESVWSDPYPFVTTHTTNDTIKPNGIPDAQEMDEGSTEDLNGDNIPDIEQISDHYKCLNTVVGNRKIAVETDSEDDLILSLQSIDPNEIFCLQAKPDYMPFGLLGFKLKVSPSSDPNMTFYLSEEMETEEDWYIYDPSKGWQDYSQNATFNNNKKSVRLRVVDGKAGDMDGVENGIIVSLLGAGYFYEEIPPPDGEAGLGAMGSCFIDICIENRTLFSYLVAPRNGIGVSSQNKRLRNVSLDAASNSKP